MAETVGITAKKKENFAEWYPEVVVKAELADYSPVKGAMVVRPNAYAMWEKFQEFFNAEIKKKGVRNAYFPLFIPESFFKKEAKHAKGFAPEVAWISNRDDSEERLAIRPTSETIIADSFAKWIRSWRDLPLKVNQWCSVVRWETRQTRLHRRFCRRRHRTTCSRWQVRDGPCRTQDETRGAPPNPTNVALPRARDQGGYVSSGSEERFEPKRVRELFERALSLLWPT